LESNQTWSLLGTMQRIELNGETDWEGWRLAARALVLAGAEPEALTWSTGTQRSKLPDSSGTFHVPRALVSIAELAIQARNADRFGLLYSLVWRINAGEKLLQDDTDPDMALARQMALAVRSDAHRMRTNMRFLPVQEDRGTRFLGWFEPAHFVLQANAQLIARRFPDLQFSIVTPDGAAHWDRNSLLFGSGLRHAEDDETLQAWWEAHRTTLLEEATAHVSVPEAESLDEAPRPLDRAALGPVVLSSRPDAELRRAMKDASTCHRCPLYEPATQTVFGEGPANATVMFVGEQPGDQEDTIGRPFVGPAGQMMDRAMEEAGIDRRTVYVTNAVKHFKFTQRGKRRIHQTPEVPEIQACGFWLDVERTHIRPRLLVLMGGSAARAVLGRAVTIGRERGRPIRQAGGQTVFVTVHPSYLLRIPDAAAKAREYEAFVRDLTSIRTIMEGDA
jgi:probable DNA metabolism protein